MQTLRKIKTFSIVSLDGFTSRIDGDIDWILGYPNPGKTDYGFRTFFDSIHSAVMNKMYYSLLQSYDLRWPLAGKPCHVINHQSFTVPQDRNILFMLTTSENHSYIDQVKELQSGSGGDIWLAGDNEMIALFMELEMVDEMNITTLPVRLGNGLPLFSRSGRENTWTHDSGNIFDNGAVQHTYRMMR